MSASLQLESGNLLRIQISGVLREVDLKEVQDVAAREIARVGAVRVLFLLDAFEGWERKADWSDTTFYEAHDRDIEKIAIVGDEKWRDEGLAFAGGGLRKAAVRFFPAAEPARAWLLQDAPGPSGK